jgi:hypothetical protein
MEFTIDHEDIALDYPEPEPYNSLHEFRFLRLHCTEDAAIASVQADVAVFRATFPGVFIHQERHYILHEYFADSGLVGCIRDIAVAVDTATYREIARWFAMMPYTAQQAVTDALIVRQVRGAPKPDTVDKKY